MLLDELRNTLARPHLASRLAQQQSSVESALSFYGQLTDRVRPRTVARVNRDPDDDHVLACALAARADFIVSGDKDLLVLERFEGIAIVNAAQALAMIEASGP